MNLWGHRSTGFFILMRGFILCLPYRRALSDDACGNSSDVWILRPGTYSCYYKHEWPKAFEIAKEGCKERDADLTSVSDDQEWKFIVDKIQKCRTTCLKPDDEYWLGLYEEKGDESGGQPWSDWKWLDGSNSTYTIWTPGEPGLDEHCARLNMKKEMGGMKCNKPYKYICKKQIGLLPESTSKPLGTTTSNDVFGSFGSDRSVSGFSTTPPDDGAPVGAYAGAGVGGFVVIAIIVVLVVILIRRRKRNRKESEECGTARSDPVYYNDLDKHLDKRLDDDSNYANGPQNTGYHDIKLSGEKGSVQSELHPGHASYAEVGQFDRTMVHNLVYDTGTPKDPATGDKDGQYDLPIINEVSAGTESSGRTGGHRKPAPRPKPSFLKRLKKPSIFRNGQGGEETGKSHGVNIKKRSRRSIRDLYAAVDFTKKRKPRQ